jgi:hypothetical protein
MSSMLPLMEQFVRTLQAARRVSTPLVSILTADPALTVAPTEEAVRSSFSAWFNTAITVGPLA